MINVKKGQPLYEQIYENLKSLIVSGGLKPGERIIDASIAEKLSVSRSPVREALRKLEQDGLLVNQDGTTLVYKPNVNDVIELFQVRAGLEGMAIYLATQLMNESQLQELWNSLLKVEQAIKEKNTDEVIRLNTYFHESIISYSMNNRLHELMSKTNTLTLLYRNKYFTKYYGNDDFYTEHVEIWKAMKDRNAELASEKMRKHILNDLEQLIERIRTQPED